MIPARPVSIVWAEQTGSLIIIDSERQAFSYAGQVKAVACVTSQGRASDVFRRRSVFRSWSSATAFSRAFCSSFRRA